MFYWEESKQMETSYLIMVLLSIPINYPHSHRQPQSRQSGSRPPSIQNGSRPPSVQNGYRPSSAQYGSRPPSVTGSRTGSRQGNHTPRFQLAWFQLTWILA